MRKLSLTMIIIVGLIAVAVPVCQMVGCSMSPGGMPFSPGAAFRSVCDGTLMMSTTPAGTLPPSSESLLLTIAAAIVAMVVLVVPPYQTSYVLLVAEDPPAPPEDPRGERLLL